MIEFQVILVSIPSKRSVCRVNLTGFFFNFNLSPRRNMLGKKSQFGCDSSAGKGSYGQTQLPMFSDQPIWWK